MSTETPMRKRKRWYVGRMGEDYLAFSSHTLPTQETYGNRYSYVIGPFRTKKAAFWLCRYPNTPLQTVSEFERAALQEAANEAVEQILGQEGA